MYKNSSKKLLIKMSTIFLCNHLKILRCCLIEFFSLYNTAIRDWPTPTLSVFTNMRAEIHGRDFNILQQQIFCKWITLHLSIYHNILYAQLHHIHSPCWFFAQIFVTSDKWFFIVRIRNQNSWIDLLFLPRSNFACNLP